MIFYGFFFEHLEEWTVLDVYDGEYILSQSSPASVPKVAFFQRDGTEHEIPAVEPSEELSNLISGVKTTVNILIHIPGTSMTKISVK